MEERITWNYSDASVYQGNCSGGSKNYAKDPPERHSGLIIDHIGMGLILVHSGRTGPFHIPTIQCVCYPLDLGVLNQRPLDI